MPVSALSTAAEMTDIHTALNTLIIILIVGLGGVFSTLFAIFKWYLPKRFEQQTAEREARLKALQTDNANKAAAEAVDIKREGMLPLLIEQNQSLVNAALTMAKSFNDTTVQRIQQDVINNGTLNATNRQMTTNTERLEEMAGLLDTAIINIQNLENATNVSRAESSAAKVAANKAAVAAEETLTFVRRKLSEVIEESKHDSRPIPTITADVTLHTADSTPAESEDAA